MIGQKIKFFLVTSISVEGIVQEWTEDYVLLRSVNGTKEDKVIINNPDKNIIMYYIFTDKVVPPKKFKLEIENFEVPPEVAELPRDLKIKTLAELKKEHIKAQQEVVRNEMNTFHSPDIKELEGRYGYPTQLNPFNNTTQESSVRKAKNFRKLRKLSR